MMGYISNFMENLQFADIDTPIYIGKMMINGNFRILKWRYLPYIRPIKGLCKGIPPQNMAKNMVLTYLHFRILEISH